MNILSKALMKRLATLQEEQPILAFSGDVSQPNSMEAYDCRSGCSGTCYVSCAGGCALTCAGSCDDGCAGGSR